MIHDALTFLANELNEHFKTLFKIDEDMVILSSLKNADGASGLQGENKVVLTLVNIEEEKTLKNATTPARGDTGVMPQPPIALNLHVLISTHFTGNNYPESLKYISEVISFFHHKNVFTPQTSPNLATGIDKLIMELNSKTLDENNAVWQMLGSTYTPSIACKVRFIASGMQ